MKAPHITIEKDAVTYYREDGAPFMRIGQHPNGNSGIYIALTKKRILHMDNVLHYKNYTKKQIEDGIGISNETTEL